MHLRTLTLSAMATLCGVWTISAPALEVAETTSCEASADAADPIGALPLKGKPAPQPDACWATAHCQDGSVLSCSTGGGGQCNGVDASCPGTRGYVICDGVRTYCPTCPTTTTCPPSSQGACSSATQCDNLCGGPGYGSCRSRCCYCL